MNYILWYQVTKDKHDTILELETNIAPYFAGKRCLYQYTPSDFTITRYPFDKQGVTIELLNRFDTLQRLYVAHEQLENLLVILFLLQKNILSM